MSNIKLIKVNELFIKEKRASGWPMVKHIVLKDGVCLCVDSSSPSLREKEEPNDWGYGYVPFNYWTAIVRIRAWKPGGKMIEKKIRLSPRHFYHISEPLKKTPRIDRAKIRREARRVLNAIRSA